MGSQTGLYAVIGVLVVALLAIGGYVFTKNNSSSVMNTTSSPTESTQNNPTKSTSPTSSPNVKEVAVSVQGVVTHYDLCRIGSCPEGSMNIGVATEEKRYGFDIYPETKIYAENGKQIDHSYIKAGQEVSVKGRNLIGNGPEYQTIGDEVRVISQTSKIVAPSIPPARGDGPPPTPAN